MRSLQDSLARQPLLSTVVLVLLCVGVLLLAIEGGLLVGAVETASTAGRFAISIALVGLLWRLGWGKGAGLARPQARWFLAMVPMSVGALAVLAGSEWRAMTFEASRFVPWLTHNVAAGLFEEVLFRGVCFYILLRAWGYTRAGLFRAALASSLLFGPLHLLSLLPIGLDSGQVISTVAQAIYATLFGIGFAGLVIYTRSLLPSVVVHALINASGSINRFFVSETFDVGRGPSGGLGQIIGYAVVIVVIFGISTLPALVYLRNGELFPRPSLGSVPTR